MPAKENLLSINPESSENRPYDQLVAEWQNKTGIEESISFYNQYLFPMSCKRVCEQRKSTAEVELLFVPVGTQPYAPILSILANPAKCVVLLETVESQEYGKQIEQTFKANNSKSIFVHCLISPSNVVDIATKVKDLFDSRGLPPGSKVSADITGGRKPTTAAISSIASQFGWRLFYVESVFERSKSGFGHHEQIIDIPNILEFFNTERRELAVAMICAGGFSKAITELEAIIDESLSSKADRNLLTLTKCCQYLHSVNRKGFEQELEKLARIIQDKAIDEFLNNYAKSDQELAFLWLATKLRLHFHDLPGASYLIASRYFTAKDDKFQPLLTNPPSSKILSTSLKTLELELYKEIPKRVMENIELILIKQLDKTISKVSNY